MKQTITQKQEEILKYLLIYGKRLTKRSLEEEDNPEDLHIQFTTVDQIKDHGVTSEIWEEV